MNGRNRVTKRVRQGKETKQRLVECASILFEEKGYHNVTVDEIIEAAGSSKGSFYTHFEHKFDLVYSLINMLDDIYMDFAPSDFKEKDSRSKLLAFVYYVYGVIAERIGLEFMSVIYSTQIQTPTSRRFPITPERAFYVNCKAIIEEGKGRNEIPTDLPTDYIIRIVTTVMRGVIYDWCFSNGEFDLAEYGTKLVELTAETLLAVKEEMS